MKLPRHALATVELYRPEDGGRAGPLLARPWLVDMRIGHETRIHYHTRVDIEEDLYPGEVRRVYLAFGYPDRVGPLLQPGTQIFPVGDVRQYWHEYRLVALDAERRVLEERHEARIMEAARRLRAFLRTTPER